MINDDLLSSALEDFSLFYSQPNAAQNKLMETAKLFDGFFLGNVHASLEEQFLSNNKIGLIINCNPLEAKMPVYEHIHSLSYDFYTKRGSLQESMNSTQIMELVSTIDEYLYEKHEGVLLISKFIDSRNFCIAAVYLMVTFDWDRQDAVNFISNKKQQLQLAPKFSQLLRSFAKYLSKSKQTDKLTNKNIREHQLVLKNTQLNSQVKQLRNFNGLCHHKSSQTPKFIPQQERLVQFIDQIQYIPSSTKPSVDTISYLEGPFQKIVETSKVPEVKKVNIKLSVVQQKLRNYIKDRCHSSHTSDFTAQQKRKMALPTFEEHLDLKSKQCLPRRRAISKTQQSVDQQQQKVRMKIKTNNFVNNSFRTMNNNTTQGIIKPSSFEEDKYRHSDFKCSSTGTSKAQLPRRCYTEATNYQHRLSDGSKLNNMFKISKNSKSSNKKLSEHPYKNKILNMKTSEKNVRRFNSEISKSYQKASLEELMTQKFAQKKDEQPLEKKRKEQKLRQNIINLNVNIQIQNLNMLSTKQMSDYFEPQRKQSSKVKGRIVPKRVPKNNQ